MIDFLDLFLANSDDFIWEAFDKNKENLEDDISNDICFGWTLYKKENRKYIATLLILIDKESDLLTLVATYENINSFGIFETQKDCANFFNWESRISEIVNAVKLFKTSIQLIFTQQDLNFTNDK